MLRKEAHWIKISILWLSGLEEVMVIQLGKMYLWIGLFEIDQVVKHISYLKTIILCPSFEVWVHRRMELRWFLGIGLRFPSARHYMRDKRASIKKMLAFTLPLSLPER